MSDAATATPAPVAVPRPPTPTTERIRSTLARRQAAEKRFQAYGIIAITIAMLMLATLFITIFRTGMPAFLITEMELEITVFEQDIDPEGTRDPDVLSRANYQALVRQAMRDLFPTVESRSARRALYELVSDGAGYRIRQMVMDNPDLINTRITMTVPVSDDFDQLAKGGISRDIPEDQRRISDQQIDWFDRLESRGLITTNFNWDFFTSADSRAPELAGIWGAAVGSFFTLAVTLCLSFPVGVATAVYLEEFAPKNRFTDIIEVNINNLAAVPSIVFGLLGLAVFLNFFGLPRSAPLVGGLVLTLMTLPTIIIAGRAALKSVPPSIREAALGVGASRLQAVTHHVLPLAMPGMLTGTIIGMAQALGETAPLLMIGMVAFVADTPGGFTDPATVLPVQIYIWSDAPQRAFVEKTSAAIIVLLLFLVFMNAMAVLLRRRFERRW